MTAGYDLIIAGAHHRALRRHLIAPDGLEAAAILFCRDAGTGRRRLMVVDMLEVPHTQCAERRADFITWPGELLAEAEWVEYARE